MPRVENYPGLNNGETAWESPTPGKVLIQIKCRETGCHHGVKYSPVRFCEECGGHGHKVREEDDRRA